MKKISKSDPSAITITALSGEEEIVVVGGKLNWKRGLCIAGCNSAVMAGSVIIDDPRYIGHGFDWCREVVCR